MSDMYDQSSPDSHDAGGRPRTEEESRRTGRFKIENLRCNLGRIQDISGGGIRLIATRRPSDRCALRLTGPDCAVVVPVLLIWAKKVRWRNWEIGMRFDSDDPAVRSVLNYICRDYRTSTEFDWVKNPPSTPDGYVPHDLR